MPNLKVRMLIVFFKFSAKKLLFGRTNQIMVASGPAILNFQPVGEKPGETNLLFKKTAMSKFDYRSVSGD